MYTSPVLSNVSVLANSWICFCSHVLGQLQLVHGAAVRTWRRNVLTPKKDWAIQVILCTDYLRHQPRRQGLWVRIPPKLPVDYFSQRTLKHKTVHTTHWWKVNNQFAVIT